MSGIEIVGIISVLGSLILLSNNSALHRLGLKRGALMALIWVAIFVVVVAIIAKVA